MTPTQTDLDAAVCVGRRATPGRLVLRDVQRLMPPTELVLDRWTEVVISQPWPFHGERGDDPRGCLSLHEERCFIWATTNNDNNYETIFQLRGPKTQEAMRYNFMTMETSSCIDMVMVSLVCHVLNREEVERLLPVLRGSMMNLHPKISAQNSPNAVNPDLLSLILSQVARPRHPFLNDEVYVEGAGARWTWRERAIACCPLHLKAKKGISSQVDAYK
ncbi:hypothetical protein PIB30_041822 [Stylosanthes scabra]|uniref:Uncharacterized protein n=1 Tax=Stylosanthes scabra TaxID=79078 RepID=A0ABU6QEJ6_9FABA|nr:hypothetical protein [Stylosanthes scabra]